MYTSNHGTQIHLGSQISAFGLPMRVKVSGQSSAKNSSLHARDFMKERLRVNSVASDYQDDHIKTRSRVNSRFISVPTDDYLPI